ncbi:MAG: DUF418 domain-containing protein [Pseudoalteromonas sp.]
MRNYNMDVIRGIAVLGLMYMNILHFGVFELGYVGLATPPSSDKWLHWISLTFMDGRFRSLFCLLFGAGLYISFQKYQSFTLQKSRLFWLGIFGLLHGFLLWAGDILFMYAVSGWFCLRYLEVDDQTLIERIKAFLLISALVTFIAMMGPENEVLYRDSEAFLSIYNESFNNLNGHLFNNTINFLIMLFVLPIIILWQTAGLMLIGMVLYKRKVFERGLSQPYLLWVSLVAASFTTFRLIISGLNNQWAFSLREPVNFFAAACVAILYIHILVRICVNRQTVLVSLQRVGRLAFSCYILQTLIMLLLFKWLFSEWIITFNRVDYFLVATIGVIVQLIGCHIYLRYFNQGPLEWCWRKLVRA